MTDDPKHTRTTGESDPVEEGREILVWALGIDADHPFEEELMDAAFAIGEKYDIDIGGIGGFGQPVDPQHDFWCASLHPCDCTGGSIAPKLHTCDAGNFDRSLCPPPCGAMHSYCTVCGVRQDPCPHE